MSFGDLGLAMLGLACVILAAGMAASFVIAAARSNKGGDEK